MRALAITAAILTVGGVCGAGAAIAARDDGHPSAAVAVSPLQQAITGLQPYAYWPLNGTGADASGNGRPKLTAAGSGPTLTHSASNPPGGSGGSVAFRPSGRQTGQYLRSVTDPVPGDTRGTLIVWFKLTRTLPSWWQTMAVDNGAATGYGAGLFVTTTGQLAYTDSAATFDPLPGTFGPARRTISGPLNDGRWHMLTFVDQYTQQGASSGWKPSLIYLDGRVIDRTIVGLMVNTFGRGDRSRMLLGSGQAGQVSRLGRFVGDVADVALFDRLLTADEIAQVWRAGS